MKTLLLAGILATAFSLFLTPVFIRLVHRLQWGQFIREDGPQTHHAKRGTPTMGGLVVITATLFGYFTALLLTGDTTSSSAILVFVLMSGLGFVGFIDDFVKTRRERSLGLTGWGKVAGQVIVATIWAFLSLRFVDDYGRTPATMSVSFLRDIPSLNFAALMVYGAFGVIAAYILYFLWINILVAAASNGVNVTDGLDGLAPGAAIFVFGAYLFIGFWQFIQDCRNPGLSIENISRCYEVRDPIDLAIVSAAVMGALVGFLWWNTAPAQIFLGDTGSLAIGGAIAALAVLTQTELLLLILGGLFVIETGSVILQRLYFKVTKGKRIFLMSPIHHHFELKGWAEVKVVVRFWIIGTAFVITGIGIFYVEWLAV